MDAPLNEIYDLLNYFSSGLEKEKPYKCSYCPKTFEKEQNVPVHERMHTGEKPYKCNLCPKAFSQKMHLSCHMRKHTNESLRLAKEEIIPQGFLNKDQQKIMLMNKNISR